MWGYLKRRLGIAHILKELQIMSGSISDMKTTMDGLAAGFSPIATSLGNVLEALAKLQASASNPSTATVIAPEDQATLDAALAEGSALQQAMNDMQTKLAAAQAPPPAVDPTVGQTDPNAPTT